MLDVHPAHHAATTWREFFIHIATIVLGLIIAVGLEQIVEFVHHHHQARDARESIDQEVATNIDIVQRDLGYLVTTQQKLTKDLDLLNSTSPDAEILQHLDYTFNLLRRRDSAWGAAKISGALALIPAGEITHANYFYESTSALTPILFTFFTDMDTAAALLDHARAAGKLTASDRQQLVSLTISAMGDDRIISRMFSSQVRALQSTSLE